MDRYLLSFRFQTKRRLYLNKTVKLHFNKVEHLKKMNSTYPHSTIDYDAIFLTHLLSAIFTKSLLASVVKKSSMKLLPRDKLKFVKGNFSNITNVSRIPISFLLSEIFYERIGGDVQRKKAFRNAFFEACTNIVSR